MDSRSEPEIEKTFILQGVVNCNEECEAGRCESQALPSELPALDLVGEVGSKTVGRLNFSCPDLRIPSLSSFREARLIALTFSPSVLYLCVWEPIRNMEQTTRYMT